ncbi:MAG: M48 family metallopeptidase [Chloroflexi bacterium]|nr:M48 family metallopeptidase [Chloroflexota bacterium]
MIALTATATVCLSVVFIAVMVLLSYRFTRAHHQALLNKAQRITVEETPELAALVAESVARLQTGSVRVFVAPGAPNAYTFGLVSPKIVVLQSALLEIMDKDELSFVLGHELGHVRLGHTRLNSLIGGMAGIPSPFVASALLSVVFLWWNRACEYSADRAGLLTCGKVSKAISALIKLEGGVGADLSQTLRHIESEDDHVFGNLLETLSTHPMMVRRIKALQRYGVSDQYRRLRRLMDQNVVVSHQNVDH